MSYFLPPPTHKYVVIISTTHISPIYIPTKKNNTTTSNYKNNHSIMSSPHTESLYRCYIMPAMATLILLAFELPPLSIIFNNLIPNRPTRIGIQALIMLSALFLICRAIDSIPGL